MAAVRPLLIAMLAALAAGAAGGARAQEVPEADVAEVPAEAAAPGKYTLLTLNETELFEKSDWGAASLRQAEQAAADLTAENRAIEASLEEEERRLTEKRAQMSAAEFSKLATEFDAKVESIRQAQDGKSRAINRRLDEDRKAFIDQAVPLMSELLDEYDAVAIIAEDVLILSRTSASVTQRAIDLMNERLPPPSEEPVAPEPVPGPQPGPDAPENSSP